MKGTPTPPPAGARPGPCELRALRPRLSRRGPSAGPSLRPRSAPGCGAVHPSRVPAPSFPPGAAAGAVPAAASILPEAQAPASPGAGSLSGPSPWESLRRPAGARFLPNSRCSPSGGARAWERGGLGPRWKWGRDPPPQGSRPTPIGSPAHNRSARREERVGVARQPGDCGLPGRGGWRGA